MMIGSASVATTRKKRPWRENSIPGSAVADSCELEAEEVGAQGQPGRHPPVRRLWAPAPRNAWHISCRTAMLWRARQRRR